MSTVETHVCFSRFGATRAATDRRVEMWSWCTLPGSGGARSTPQVEGCYFRAWSNRRRRGRGGGVAPARETEQAGERDIVATLLFSGGTLVDMVQCAMQAPNQ